jgi:hypothetical protein
MAAEVVVVAAVEAEEEKTGPAVVEAGAVVEELVSADEAVVALADDPKDVAVDEVVLKPIEVLAEERQERSVAPLPTDTTHRTSTRHSHLRTCNNYMTSEMQETQQEESVP